MITSMIPNPDNVFGICSSGGGSEIADTWVRPTEWLALPDNIDGVQKISILNAVFDTDSELVALMCQGAYTVDWGDGVVENFADNVKAEHKYTYSDVDLNSDAVATFGYKQCIITITPQSGQNLTLINLNQYHTSIGSGTFYDLVTGFLDMRINALSCTTLVIGAIAVSEYVQHRMLEQCVIGQIGNILDSSSMFATCTRLQSVPLFNLASATTTTSMFANCYSLQSVPLFNLSFITNNTNILFGCYSLKKMNLPLRFTFSVANAKMSASALNEMYSILPTVSGQTVTVTGNYGVSGDDPTIATLKGWTVVS